MSRWKIYTPEGVQDILFDECYLKREIESSIRGVFKRRGFFELETPTIEFYDVFAAESELIQQETLFKFFDSNGRILVLRPDITIPIARLVANKIKDFIPPLRACYIGNTFRYDEIGGGKQKEFTQAGVEIIGVSGSEADAEVIAAAINAVRSTGLENFQVEIGQIEFFKGIMEESCLNDDEVEQIRLCIDSKDYLGLEELVESHDLKEELGSLILSLPGLFGTSEVIDRALKSTRNGRSLKALDNLKKVLSMLQDYGLGKYISVDLGMVQSINYYTGIIFKGFTYGVGFPILGGGRYDGLIGKFGRDMPATGFAIGVNLLMMALDRQKAASGRQEVDSVICYEENGRNMAFKLAEELRSQNMNIELDICLQGMELLKEYCKSRLIGGIINVLDEGRIDVHNIATGEIKRTSVREILGG